MNDHTPASPMTGKLPSILLKLAYRQGDIAADEATATPYWTPYPPTSSAIARRQLRRTEDDHLIAAN